MKKNVLNCLLVVTLLAFCLGINRCQIQDDANSQAIGYVTGKGMGLAINKFAPRTAPTLEANWKDMMARNSAVDPIPGTEIVGYFNSSVLALAGEVNDPYGLLGDLSVFATIYGAQFAPDGKMTFVQPIPKVVANFFQMGYSSGKQLALK